MTQIANFANFLVERQDFEAAQQARAAVQEWIETLKADCESMLVKCFPTKFKPGQQKALYDHYRYRGPSVMVQGVEVIVYNSRKSSPGEFYADRNAIGIFNSDLSVPLQKLYAAAIEYLKPRVSEAKRQALREEAQAAVAAVLDFDFTPILSNLHHEFIHYFDEKDWMTRSTTRMGRQLSKGEERQAKRRGVSLRDYQDSPAADKHYFKVYFNSDHEINAYFRTLVSDLLELRAKGALPSLASFKEFKTYCIDNFNFPFSHYTTAKQKSVLKRLYLVHKELFAQENNEPTNEV